MKNNISSSFTFECTGNYKNNYKLQRIAAGCGILLLSAVTGCSSGNINQSIREANNNFRYLDDSATSKELRTPVNLDPLVFSNEYSLPKNVIRDSRAAIVGRHVDVRPPQKLIPLDGNVVTRNDGDLSQIWFFPDEQGRVMNANELFAVLLKFLNRNGMDIESIDPVQSFVHTDWYECTEFVTPYDNEAMQNNALIYRQKYLFRLIKNSNNIPGIAVQITDNIMEKTDGEELSAGLNRFEPARFSALMANRLLRSYHEQQNMKYASGKKDIEITIGRDNNDLPCWIITASFDETYTVLMDLMKDYDIKIVEYSSTGGDLKIDYSELEPEEWQKLETEPWGIDSGKYTFKVGVYEGKSTITLYDKSNHPVSSGVIARMYSGFSISLNNQFNKHRNKKD